MSADIETESASEAAGPLPPAKPRLLIVDDEEYVRDALGRFLELRGFSVDVARGGLEAVDKCARNTYHLVTMDLEMPNLSGREAISRIRSLCPELPILVLSGYAHLLDDHPLPGVAGVLKKPISLWKVEEEIRKFIPGRASTVT